MQPFEISEPSVGVPEVFAPEGFVPTDMPREGEYYVINDSGLAVPRDLPASGTIRQSQVIAEFGGGSNLRSYLGAAAGVPSSGNLKLTDFYGKSASNAVSSYVFDYYKHNSSNNYGGQHNLGYNQGSGQLPSDSGDYYWPISDKPFEIVNDPEMPTSTQMNTWGNTAGYQPGDGAYDNCNVASSGISGSISTGSVNGAHLWFRRSKGFCFQKVKPGTNTFSCRMYASYNGDPNLGTQRVSRIRAYIREFDNPVAHNTNFLKMATKGNRHYLGEAYQIYSQNAQTRSITVTTTLPYIFVEVYYETNSYSSVTVGAHSWKVNA